MINPRYSKTIKARPSRIEFPGLYTTLHLDPDVAKGHGTCQKTVIDFNIGVCINLDNERDETACPVKAGRKSN